MATNVTGALTDFVSSLGDIAPVALGAGAAGLLAWVGWRLACKLINRGVGK